MRASNTKPAVYALAVIATAALIFAGCGPPRHVTEIHYHLDGRERSVRPLYDGRVEVVTTDVWVPVYREPWCDCDEPRFDPPWCPPSEPASPAPRGDRYSTDR